MTHKIITTNLNLEDEAKVILSLETKIKELKELRDERVAEVRKVMETNHLSALQAGSHLFKLTEVTRNNIDTKVLKTDFADIYKRLLKVSSYFKFETI